MLYISFIVVGLLVTLVAAVAYIKLRFFPGKGNHSDEFIGNRRAFATVGSVVLGLCIVVSIYSHFGTVKFGHVGVKVWLNEVITDSTFSEGLYRKNVVMGLRQMSVQRRTVTRHASAEEGDKVDLMAISKNNVALSVDATFAWVLSKEYAPLVLRNLGNDRGYEVTLIYPTTAEALRNATAEYTDEQAYSSMRADYTESITTQFEEAIVRQLRGIDDFADFPEEELRKVIRVLPVSLRRVEPPEQILAAIERKVAADQELLRQETMIDVAERRSQAQGNDGLSMASFFASLPEETTVEEGIDAYNAFTFRRQTDALADALEKGNVSVAYLGNGNMPVAAK